ncbi:hypothetical protein DENIS_0878 [Desulfonema ishimotonii]|uniref:Knr4/Smi1-like domain-containing protein n=1 Tax=Desulfonema ishimotonii TaxID=45657 RepID=A0A401FSK2_9BACT|nr:SMI1/KNR4 family protein [Desulfonema ishimotonii]GBC59936.1 hypothetical protein DENIS_0878 [Desulfonema ishimotonii]
MDIEHIKINLEKRYKKNGLIYSLGNPLSEKELNLAEERLNLILPNQLKIFYKCYNGLKVDKPGLQIFPINDLELNNDKIINFALMDNKHMIAFDTSHLNDANQWNIINPKNNYLITLTFASFWSNKIWAWIDKHRAIWQAYDASDTG